MPVHCLIGGKWTTFRAFAEAAADRVLADLGLARRITTRGLAIGGGRDFPREGQARRDYVSKLALMGGITPARAEALLSRYGTRALAFCATLRGRGEAMLTQAPDHSVEEIRHIAATEKVGGLEDIIHRRTLIGLLGGDCPALRAELSAVLEAPARRESA